MGVRSEKCEVGGMRLVRWIMRKRRRGSVVD